MVENGFGPFLLPPFLLLEISSLIPGVKEDMMDEVPLFTYPVPFPVPIPVPVLDANDDEGELCLEPGRLLSFLGFSVGGLDSSSSLMYNPVQLNHSSCVTLLSLGSMSHPLKKYLKQCRYFRTAFMDSDTEEFPDRRPLLEPSLLVVLWPLILWPLALLPFV